MTVLPVVRKRNSSAGVNNCPMFLYWLIKIRIAFARNVCGPSSRKQLVRPIHKRMTSDQLEISALPKTIQVARFCGLMGASASLTTTCPCNLKLAGRFMYAANLRIPCKQPSRQKDRTHDQMDAMIYFA